jgi:hypothetical protein
MWVLHCEINTSPIQINFEAIIAKICNTHIRVLTKLPLKFSMKYYQTQSKGSHFNFTWGIHQTCIVVNKFNIILIYFI